MESLSGSPSPHGHRFDVDPRAAYSHCASEGRQVLFSLRQSWPFAQREYATAPCHVIKIIGHSSVPDFGDQPALLLSINW
jgi:hypothetical protein